MNPTISLDVALTSAEVEVLTLVLDRAQFSGLPTLRVVASVADKLAAAKATLDAMGAPPVPAPLALVAPEPSK